MNKKEPIIETYIRDDDTIAKQSLSFNEKAIINIVFYTVSLTILTIGWRLLELFFDGGIITSNADTIIAVIFTTFVVITKRVSVYKWFLKHIKKD